MLHIEPDQWQALEDHMVGAFEARSFAHAQRWFSHHCSVLGRVQMGVVIRQGLALASAHGLSPESCVRCYTDAMCLFGSGFADDPLLPWASAVLNDPTTAADPFLRADRLHEQLWAWRDRVAPDAALWAGAGANTQVMDILRSLHVEGHAPLGPQDEPALLATGERMLLQLLPSRCLAAGPQALRQRLSQAASQAAGLGIRGRKGCLLVSLLSVGLGHAWADDPLLPWASAALRDPALGSEAQRVDRLFADGVACLRQWRALVARAPHPA